MNLIFTQHVRALASGAQAIEEDSEAAWDKLRDALRSEMVRRGIWDAPPSYLGIFGRASWSQSEAFEELLSDCYIFSFIRCLPSLEAFLERQPNIEGLIFRNIRNFLFELQKRYDPIGYRVFRVLRTAIRRSLDAATLFVLTGNPLVSNETVLAWRVDPSLVPISRTDLGPKVVVWCEALLPDLVVSRATQLDKVIATLCQYLEGLAREGIECFRFKDMIDPFKGNVRLAWTARWLSSEGVWAFEDGSDDMAHLVQLVQPSSGFEERDLFEQLLECVAESLDKLQGRKKTRLYLERLWVFLRSHAAEEQPAPKQPVPNQPAPNQDLPWTDALPAQHQIAGLLDIPRYRLPELRATLGRLVDACRGCESADGSAGGSGSDSLPFSPADRSEDASA